MSERDSKEEEAPQQRKWRKAKDPKTGRWYYFDVHTRETQWEKPLELASASERHRILENQRRTKEFFEQMEANVRRRVAIGEDISYVSPPGSPRASSAAVEPPADYFEEEERKHEHYPSFWEDSQHRVRNGLRPGRPVRTISHMDDSIIEQLRTTNNAELNDYDASALSATVDTSSSYGMDLIGLGQGAPVPQRPSKVVPLATKRNSLLPISWKRRGRRSRHRPTNRRATEANTGIADAAFTELEFDFMGLNEDYEDIEDIMERGDGRQRRVSRDDSHVILQPTSAAGADADQRRLHRERAARSNSTSTLFVSDTMAEPDKEATIKCVCCVIRAHMLEAAVASHISNPRAEEPEEFQVFVQPQYLKPTPSPGYGSRARRSNERLTGEIVVPKLERIVQFFRHVYLMAEMEIECIIMTLIYVEKLLKECEGRLKIRYFNWESILFSCMILASKVWDDLSMWNEDFHRLDPNFTLERINLLEREVLKLLKFNTIISAGEYAKYYFSLRTMAFSLNLHHGGDREMRPLNMRDAKKLMLRASRHHNSLSQHREALMGVRESRAVTEGDFRSDYGQHTRVDTDYLASTISR